MNKKVILMLLVVVFAFGCQESNGKDNLNGIEFKGRIESLISDIDAGKSFTLYGKNDVTGEEAILKRDLLGNFEMRSGLETNDRLVATSENYYLESEGVLESQGEGPGDEFRINIIAMTDFQTEDGVFRLRELVELLDEKALEKVVVTLEKDLDNKEFYRLELATLEANIKATLSNSLKELSEVVAYKDTPKVIQKGEGLTIDIDMTPLEKILVPGKK